jgi:enoyl-CoA hydratase/carnithine racemase
MSTVLVSEDAGIGRITLNRPDAMNAVTVELAGELERALVALAETVHVIVIRGAGGNFSVGGDFKQLERLRADGPDAMRELFVAFRRACDVIARLPVPVVAAVEGYALAGGFELMQACDLAIVRADASIGDNHSNFGQVPGGGSTQRLPRLVGRQRALGLIITGDKLSGEEAATWGLAYRAVPAEAFDDAVDDLAERIAAKDRAALARTKALVHAGLEQPLAAGLDAELEGVLEHLAGESAAAGIDRFTSRATEAT